MDSESEIEEQQLKAQIEEEENLSANLFGELSDKNLKLIILNSQLAAEKGRTAYINNLLQIKEIAPQRFEEDNFNIIKLGFRLDDVETRISTFEPFKRDSDISINSEESYNPNSITRRFSEMPQNFLKEDSIISMPFEEKRVNLHQHVKDIQSSLILSRKKNKDLKSSLEFSWRTLQNLEESNEKFKEITLNLEEKVNAQEDELQCLRNELINKERQIKIIKHLRDESNEETIVEKNNEIDRLKAIMKSLVDKIQKSEEDIKEVQEIYRKTSEENSTEVKMLRAEIKSYLCKIEGLNSEIDTLRATAIEKAEETSQLLRNFEAEKLKIALRHQDQIDELKIQLKTATERYDLMNSDEDSENELSELEDTTKRFHSHPIRIMSLNFDYKGIDNQESVQILDNLGIDLLNRSENDTTISYKSAEVQASIDAPSYLSDESKAKSKDLESKLTQVIEEKLRLAEENEFINRRFNDLIESYNALQEKSTEEEKKFKVIEQSNKELMANRLKDSDLVLKVNELEKNVRDLSSECLNLTRNYLNLKTRAGEHEMKISKLEQENMILLEERNTDKEKIERMILKINKLKDRNSKLSLECSGLAKSQCSLKTNIEEQEIMIKKLELENKCERDRNMEISYEKCELIKQFQSLAAENSKLKFKIEEHSNKNAKLHAILLTLHHHHKILKSSTLQILTDINLYLKSTRHSLNHTLIQQLTHPPSAPPLQLSLTSSQLFPSKPKPTRSSFFSSKRSNPLVLTLFSRPID